MKKYLLTNGKLEQSAVMTYAFNLPAVLTCPQAGSCKRVCFALIEQAMYKQAMAHRQASLELSKSQEFFDIISEELTKLRAKHTKLGTKFAIRIHASGDFYSAEYVQAWDTIIRNNLDIQFYAYTKSVKLLKEWSFTGNMQVIFSVGGLQDTLINTDKDRHAKIFKTEEECALAGYNINASEDDSEAWQSSNKKVGLIVFGARKSKLVV